MDKDSLIFKVLLEKPPPLLESNLSVLIPVFLPRRSPFLLAVFSIVRKDVGASSCHLVRCFSPDCETVASHVSRNCGVVVLFKPDLNSSIAATKVGTSPCSGVAVS